MKWLPKSKRGKATFIFAGLVIVLGVSGYLSHVRSKSAVDEYRDQLRAAGEKLDVSELIPPRVPPEQNSAAAIRSAAGMLEQYSSLSSNLPSAMLAVAPGKAMIASQKSHVINTETSNSWREAESVLAVYGGIVGSLQPTVEHPTLDFELEYQRGFQMKFDHLLPMKRSVQLLSATTVFDLHRGDIPSAVTNNRAMLAVIKGTKDERLVISQLVRIASAAIASYASWELLQSPALTDEQLAAVQRDWMEIEFIRPMEYALLMERAMQRTAFDQARTSNIPPSAASVGSSSPSSPTSSGWFDNLVESSKSAVKGTKRKAAVTLWRVSWSYDDELRTLQGEQVLLELYRQIQTNGFFMDANTEKERRLKALGIVAPASSEWDWFWIDDDGDIRTLFSKSVIAVDYFKRVMRIEAHKQLTVTAIALKRYQLRHGTYPATLDAVVPDFLPAVPRDPVDGKQLRYQLNPDGTFRLYSIGENLKDDGGDATSSSAGPPTRSMERGRDWVWPQPATAKEIEDYEKEMSSPRH